MPTKRKAAAHPELVIDVELEEPKPDPRLCQCKDVQRRWDGDGLVATEDGVNYYACSVCGKMYS